MSGINALASEFLSQKTFAVAGVSRFGDDPGELIVKKLREAGKTVYSVNPRADTSTSEGFFPSVSNIPSLVDVVVVTTHPDHTISALEDCAIAGVSRVWIHRSFGQGSLSPQAVEFCHANGITAIAGGCPMMYCRPVDFGHKCMRWILAVSGRLP